MIAAWIIAETTGIANTGARILHEGWALHVAAAGLLDCLGDDDDFARPCLAGEKRDAAANRA